ncbi:hypothetical protein U1Q18_040774 [Sarracenia purpurea var. burkii]
MNGPLEKRQWESKVASSPAYNMFEEMPKRASAPGEGAMPPLHTLVGMDSSKVAVAEVGLDGAKSICAIRPAGNTIVNCQEARASQTWADIASKIAPILFLGDRGLITGVSRVQAWSILFPKSRVS